MAKITHSVSVPLTKGEFVDLKEAVLSVPHDAKNVSMNTRSTMAGYGYGEHYEHTLEITWSE